ncbi:hypothetical protein ACFWBF_29805 [Streptomyces sp. NPDC060028]|uniref:hypothetical protein n=1 Tax=Streptomyces sp. NPDC060028 TaxID=3347041 RepID=UPI0036C7F329
MDATVKRYGQRQRTARGGRMTRCLVTAGAAVVLAAVAAGPATAVARPDAAAAGAQVVAEQQRTGPGILAARSTHVRLVNLTDRHWTFGEASLSHGIWSSGLPEVIAPYSAGDWQSESNGVMTGTEGRATYSTANGPVEVRWNNPFVGSNTYSCRVPSGYSCQRFEGSGDNASVTFEVRAG